MVSDEYLAGVFDGEGSISLSIYGDPPNLALLVRVTQQTPILVGLLYKRFGGQVYTNKSSQNKLLYSWTITGKNAKESLKVFEQYCQYKNREATLALEMVGTIVNHSSIEVDWNKRFDITERRKRIRSELYQE